MAHPRAYANGVVLPNGGVLVIGGQTHAHQFYDDHSVLTPELGVVQKVPFPGNTGNR